MTFLEQAAVFLLAAVIAAPLSKRLGLGSVLGYLVAGLLLGPAVLGLASDPGDLFDVSQLGLVLLFFVIGLELQPQRLWALRRLVFGLGCAQVAASGAVLGLALHLLLGVGPVGAALLGVILALSSTAFPLQTLAERGQLTTRYGRTTFAVLLLQDLAVIPLLAAIPLLALNEEPRGGWPLLLDLGQAALAIALLILGGRLLLRVVLPLVARTGIPEIFTALALLTVAGSALAMEAAGLSMALGAFLAGVLLAGSSYRHQLQADIEPFKGLLLGLFFMAVGMGVDIGLVAREPALALGVTLGFMALKAASVYLVARAGGMPAASARGLSVMISQGGEFAFVLIPLVVSVGLVAAATGDLLVVAATLSLALTPLAFAGVEQLGGGRAGPPREAEPPPPEHNPVIIAGFGRVGQIVGRVLRARRVPFTALEISAEQVDFVARFGNKVYYGDASRPELLRAAQAEHAKVFVLAIDDVEASLRTARVVRQLFPRLQLVARARNRQHAYALMELGATLIERETFRSSLVLAKGSLRGLGLSESEAQRTVERFREADERRLQESYAHRHDEARLQLLARQMADELREILDQDEAAEAEEERRGEKA